MNFKRMQNWKKFLKLYRGIIQNTRLQSLTSYSLLRESSRIIVLLIYHLSCIILTSNTMNPVVKNIFSVGFIISRIMERVLKEVPVCLKSVFCVCQLNNSTTRLLA